MGELIEAFCSRYPNDQTRRNYRGKLNQLFRDTGARHPSELTEEQLIRWCAGFGRRYANNTVRQRATQVHTFYRWCVP